MTSPARLAPGTVVLAANEYRTIFVYVADKSSVTRRLEMSDIVASSSTFKRKRGLGRSVNGQHFFVDAPTFTEKQIRRHGAGLVAGYLAEIGLDVAPGTEVFWCGAYNELTRLGAVELAA